MVGYWLLVCHVIGDFALQSDWMANNKRESWTATIAHSVFYTLPFALMMPRWEPLALIGVSHAIIDRYKLARYFIWAKNLICPPAFRHPWSECKTTGFHESVPLWLATGLLIATDNVMHLIFNGLAWYLWGAW